MHLNLKLWRNIMSRKRSIIELVEAVLQELERLDYSYSSIKTSRLFYKRVINYAESEGEIYYSEEIGNKFLAEYYNCRINIFTDVMPKNLRYPIRRIRILGDYQLHGIIFRRKKMKPEYICPSQFHDSYTAFEKECERRDYSKRGMRSKMNRLRNFLDYLDDVGIKSLEEISPKILSAHAKATVHHHSKSISSNLTAQRTFLKFLYLEEYISKDLSLDVPKVKNYYCPKIPSVWNTNDIKRMLKVIDKGSPIGKRDYAILLIVTRLGIRVGDLKELTLNNLKWETKSIEFTQHKTNRIINYPILDDIGWALIDYLKNGRPKTKSPYLFIRYNPPFQEFGENANLHNIIKKYTIMAGIKIPHHAHQGMHSLRHTLAGTLLENNTPLPVIAEILGHMNIKSTNVYLKVGIEGLRRCALNPEEVFKGE